MMAWMKITLRTKSSVLLSGPGNNALLTTTRDVFGGSTIRGLAATRYIGKKGLGMNAHEDAEFRRFFFGNLRFVDAYPVSSRGEAIPLPISLQKSKLGNDIIDLLDGDGQPAPGYKALRGLGVVTNDNRIIKMEISKSMTFHMSRSGVSDATNGKNNRERLSGKSEEGHIYNYESIDAGQTFSGFLIGARQTLEDLKSVLGESWEGRAGRSKYVEYGEVECMLGNVESLPDEKETSSCSPRVGNIVRLRLHTPLLPFFSDATNAKAALTNTVAKELNERRGVENVFSIGRVFANTEPSDSFVGVWRLRRPRQTALSAGSCFTLEKRGGVWDEEDIRTLQMLMYEGVGQRVEEGFGQLRFWPQAKRQIGDEAGADQNENAERKIISDEVRAKAEAIVKAKRLEQFRLFAFKDVEKSSASITKHPAHVFVRLDSFLPLKNEDGDTQEIFKARLEKTLDSKNSTAFSNHLKEITITMADGSRKSLYDLLKNASASPYSISKRLDAKDSRMAAFYADIGQEDRLRAEDGDVFRTYWHWFFRHARKWNRANGEEA